MGSVHIDLSENQQQKLNELKEKEKGTSAEIIRKALNQYYRQEQAGQIRLPEGTKAIQISFLK